MLQAPGPEPAELELILRAGLRVPDHKRLAPWRIQVLRPDAQRRLGDRLAAIFAAEHPEATPERIDLARAWPAFAPLLLVVTARIDQEHEAVPEIEQLLSGGAVCQNMLVAAHALGFAAQWLTEWPAYHPDVRRLLGHAPEDAILGFIFVGTPSAEPDERPRVRPQDVVHEWADAGELGPALGG